jgi:hypothetical protein
MKLWQFVQNVVLYFSQIFNNPFLKKIIWIVLLYFWLIYIIGFHFFISSSLAMQLDFDF